MAGGGDQTVRELPTRLAERFASVRAASERLAEPLSPEDCTVQSMPDASPVKWHLAHTSWYFETFVLEALPGFRPFDAHFRVLFNSYYNAVGEQFARPQRGLLSRPSLDTVVAYRRHVDERVRAWLEDGAPGDPALAAVLVLGIEHEQQHQELMLTDCKHLLSMNPMRPAYRKLSAPARCAEAPLRWCHFDAGLCEIGHAGSGFAFDNETPRHRVHLEAFELASRPVTNGEYLAFMEDGGYVRPEYWLADGWATVQREGWRAPLYWEPRPGGWRTATLGGLRDVREEEPVCHVSFYEADAHARWAGARLPSEAEWERAAAGRPVAGNLRETDLLHPAAAPAGEPIPTQLFGDVWEWTRSAYAAYPGFRPPEGALGEYNGKFMSNQMVLRGGSCLTPGAHLRASYRNFFYPDARWQMAGLRLARDAG